jgi:hypothetical protein
MHTGTQFTCFTSTKDKKRIRVKKHKNKNARRASTDEGTELQVPSCLIFFFCNFVLVTQGKN